MRTSSCFFVATLALDHAEILLSIPEADVTPGVNAYLSGPGSVLNYEKWGGYLNGALLPEGKHKLRLHLKSSKAPDQFADTILDLTPPTLTDLDITEIVQHADSDDVDYTFSYKLSDEPKSYILNQLPAPI